MDTYAQHLAADLDIPVMWTEIYEKHDFGLPLLAPHSIRLAWRDARFASRLRRLRTPLHLPNQHLGRYVTRLTEPFVITVHDIIRYFDMSAPESALIAPPDLRDRLYLTADYSGVRRATAVIANSNATKQDIVRHLGVSEERVFVTYLAIEHSHFRPVGHRINTFPYILFVGVEQPRKNFQALLAAFSIIKRNRRFQDLKLLKIGSAGGVEARFREATNAAITRLGLKDDVIIVGRVPYEDLPAYYSGAQCLVMPSLSEGFGYPPLEAMACGCPVVISDCAALIEVARDAAEVADVGSAESLADSILGVLLDPVGRDRLVERGLLRAAEFTRARMAMQTREVYKAMRDLQG
jgi:glycosyltransferase involved in cell wall biosynthesis